MGFVVPIPTEPTPVVVITVPPAPTIILSPAVNNPLDESNFNFVDVPNSSEELNKSSWLFPGANTVTVTAVPGFAPPTPCAVIASPTKFNWVVLLNPPTSVFSLKTLIDPGIIPPPTGIQYLSPGYPSIDTIWYCCPKGGKSPGKIGLPRLGSAWLIFRYPSLGYSCEDNLDLPLRYFGILIMSCYFLECYK